MIKTTLAMVTIAIIFAGCVGTVRLAEQDDKKNTLHAKPLSNENNVTKKPSERK